MSPSMYRLCSFFLATVVNGAAFAQAQVATNDFKTPGAAMILSTGDNLFYYKWFPIDSTAGIGASFDLFKSYYGVDRIIWRGAQAQWMAYENVFRPEPDELADLYVLEMDLETKERLSIRAGEEARKRGLAYWGYMPFFEVGASAEAVAMAGFGPYAFEEKIRAEHPEYRLYDRAGLTDGSTIEFGYPQVRKYFTDRYDKMFSSGGEFSCYEGIIFYTYVENFFPRFSDQFIYSDVAATDFKKRYGVDIYTQPFDIEKYQEMRGEYITTYLRELRQVFKKHGKKLAFYIDAREPGIPQRWPSYPDILVPGRVKMDWQQWVKEGLVDEIALRSAEDLARVRPFLEATEGTTTRVSILTSAMPPELKPLYARGVTQHIWAPELASDFPPGKAPVSALDGNDRVAIMSVLRQARDAEVDVPLERIVSLFQHPDLIVRRQAVAAVLGRRMAEAIPALEQATMDPENSFRAVVIDALGTLHGPNTVATIGRSLEKYPTAGMRIVARTAWSMMIPERANDLVELYHQTNSAYVRGTIIEMLVSKRAVPAIDAIPAFRPLVDAAAKDQNSILRSIAAFATAYYPDRHSAELLLEMMDDPSEVVQNAAAFSLGEVARRIDHRDVREAIFDRLVSQEKLYGAQSKRSDQKWGYRVVAEALMFGFGPRGERHVARVLNGQEPVLADLAWRVLFHPNDGWNFYPIDREAGEALTAYHPRPNRTGVARKAYTLPPEAEVLNQPFTGLSPDPRGIVGSVWTVAAKWSGIDSNVQFANADGKPLLALSVGQSGKGARLMGTVGYDLPDKRFKNRLRGHFPASPVAYGVGDGVVEVSVSIRRVDPAAEVQLLLKPEVQSKESVGFSVAGDGQARIEAKGEQHAAASTGPAAGKWERFRLRLDFRTATATLLAPDRQDGPVAQAAFDADKRYRAVSLSAAGQPGSSVQAADLRITQTFE